MKKLKNLSIVLVVFLIASLVFGLNVQAASTFTSLSLGSVNGSAKEYTYDGKEYVTKQSSKLKLFIYGAEMSNVISDNEEVAVVDEEGKITIKAVGNCKFKINGVDETSSNVVSLKVISDADFESIMEIKDTLASLKISGEKAKWYPEGELSKFPCGEILVGGTAQIVDSEGKKLSDKYDSVRYEIDNSYSDADAISVTEDGLVTGLSAGSSYKTGVVNVYIGDDASNYSSVEIRVVNAFGDSNDFAGPVEDEPDNEESSVETEKSDGTTPDEVSVAQNADNKDASSSNAEESAKKGQAKKELDDEPKAGINSSSEIFVSGLAILSLAIAIIVKKM